MSKLQQALTEPVITAASTDELVAAAQVLLRAAFDSSRDDTAGLSDVELLEQVLAAQRVQNVAWATQTRRLDQLAKT